MSHWKVFGWSDPELDQPAPVRSSLLFEDYAVANITKLKYHSAFYLTIIIKRKSHMHLLWLFSFELIDFWWQQMNSHNAVFKKTTDHFPAGGYFAGSLAVMTDAAHLLVDFFSFIISLLSLWLSSRPATHRLNYGWHRAGTVKTTQTKYIFSIAATEWLFSPLQCLCFSFWLHSTSSPQCFNPAAVLFSAHWCAEILGALLSVFTIWLVTGVLVYLAVERLVSNDYTIEGTVMLITSGCAVLANIM